jgi:hypothetical protein
MNDKMAQVLPCPAADPRAPPPVMLLGRHHLVLDQDKQARKLSVLFYTCVLMTQTCIWMSCMCAPPLYRKEMDKSFPIKIAGFY